MGRPALAVPRFRVPPCYCLQLTGPRSMDGFKTHDGTCRLAPTGVGTEIRDPS